MKVTRAGQAAAAAITLAVSAIVTTGVPIPARADHGNCRDAPDVEERPPLRERPATLEPGVVNLTIPAGEQEEVGFRLKRPASPTPVDIYFLVDTTGSMSSAICGVQAGLVDIALGLREAGIDPQFGVGEYRDYPIEPWGQSDDFAYRQQRPMGPLNQDLIRAVNRLTAAGGGDGLESALAALYQSATGAGQDVRPKGESNADIQPNQQARFRERAIRVVVNVTDVAFREPERERNYPGPPWTKVVQTLRAHDILQVGIAAETGGRGALMRMARDTGALTPTDVDCNADGRTDLRAGDPLVCNLEQPALGVVGEAEAPHLAPAIINMIKAIKDLAPVEHGTTGEDDVVAAVRPRVSKPIDLRERNVVPFTVTFACTGPPGERRLRVGSKIRDATVARSTVRVVCEPPITPVLTAPQAAPAAPGPETQAQSFNPAPQAQPNPGAQPVAAVAPQQQPRTALAHALDATPEQGWSMTRVRAHPVPIGAAAALLAGIAAWGPIRRRTAEARRDPG